MIMYKQLSVLPMTVATGTIKPKITPHVSLNLSTFFPS